ncbi:MAG: phage terminase large subunit [Geminicoccaceae bacterium]
MAEPPVIGLPAQLDGCFEPGKKNDILRGGRGSGKSWAIAAFLVLMAMQAKYRILCAREYQTSIKESVKALLASGKPATSRAERAISPSP